MNHFIEGFQSELEKMAATAPPVHWTTAALPVLHKTVTPALFTGGLGALIGSRVADDPAKGAAKGALIGALAGALPGSFHEIFMKRYPEIGPAILEGAPITLGGAGAGAALGGLLDDEDRARGAALGALAGGALLGIPAYHGIAKRPPLKWHERI